MPGVNCQRWASVLNVLAYVTCLAIRSRQAPPTRVTCHRSQPLSPRQLEEGKKKKSKQTSIVAARVARRQRRRCCRRPLRLLRWLESGQGLTFCLHRPTSGYCELPPTGPQRQRPGHNSAGVLVLNFTEWRTRCSRNYSPAVRVCVWTIFRSQKLIRGRRSLSVGVDTCLSGLLHSVGAPCFEPLALFGVSLCFFPLFIPGGQQRHIHPQ